jgi:rRNA maturation endonuclease Nob1
MKQTIEAKLLDNGQIEPHHEIEVVCKACGYDLDESELEADTCSDCGVSLELKQSTKIHATSVPAAGGKVF